MKILRRIFYLISRNNFIYRVAKRLVFDHRGENNCEIDTNGEMLVLKKYLCENEVIFDVGANVGDWTKTVLDIIPNAKVHCFEPGRSTYSKLEQNIDSKNVVFNNFGLGSANEEKAFYIFDNDSTVNSLYLRDELVNKNKVVTEKVAIKKLDDYCSDNKIQKIDFLKIDVEGNEMEVLKGAKRMLEENNIKIIQLEYGGTYIDAGILLKDLFDFFKDFSFSFYKILFNGIQPVCYTKDLENFQYCNYLIINNNQNEKNY